MTAPEQREDSSFAKMMYEQGVADERERRRKADAAKRRLPKGYRIVQGPFRNGTRAVVLERWEGHVEGPFWHRRLEYGWHSIAEERYQRWDDEAAKARLIATAHLEEETNPIELRWSQPES